MAEEKGYSLMEVNREPAVMTDMARKHLAVIEVAAKVKAAEPFAVHLKVGASTA